MIDGSDHTEKNFTDLGKIFKRFGEFFGENTILFFSKNDCKKFNIIPFLDFLKDFGVLGNVKSVGEFNVLESGLREKVLGKVVRF